MAIIYDYDINKHTNWDGDESTFGKPVSGRVVLKFIKDTLNKKIGFVVEDLKKGKFYGFADKEDYLKYLLTNDESLIISKWNNPTLEKGVRIYTQSEVDLLGDVDPEKYITIPDPTDLDKPVENKTYDTSINGPLANILFSAVRLLQSEITKIKNSFNYGLYSYTGTNTAMSKVVGDYSNEEDEPLWAVDKDGLSFIAELSMDGNNELVPLENVNVDSESTLKITSEGASWRLLNNIEIPDTKAFIYITSSNKNIVINLYNQTGAFSLDLNTLETPLLDFYNILVVISKKTTIEENLYGDNYIWISISDPKTNTTIAEGYYNNNSLLKSIQYLEKEYDISSIEFKNIVLSNCQIFSKYQDFSKLVIPSLPTDSNYSYKVAHITIRSVESLKILEKIQELLPNNELIFVEDTKKLYIKNQYKIIAIGSGGSDEPIEEDDMTREEVLQILEEMGIVKIDNEGLSLSDVSGFTLIHLDTGTKFNLLIDSEGNIHTSLIPDNSLAKRIRDAFDSDSIGDDNKIRGFVGRLGLEEHNVIDKDSSEASYSETSDIKLYSDRIKIGAFYAPSKINSVFGCSHCFIELENTSNKDFLLEGCYLHFARNNSQGEPIISHLALKGFIPAGGTYLIRGAKKSDFDDPNTFIKVETFDLEWYENGELLDFSHNGIVIEDNNGKKVGNDPHGFALTYNTPDIEYNTLLWVTNPEADSKAPYLYRPDYIDSVYYNTTFSSGNIAYWTTTNERMYYIKDNIFPDCIYRNTFELDPAKLAYQALNTYDSSRIRHANTADYQYLYLGKEFIEFPKTSEKYPISKFTPKASFEHKNVCTDKTQLDVEKPNMVTCSFGKNPYTTRCFNWVSGGLFDEYVFIKQRSSWIKFESYKEGDENKVLEEGPLKRKEFNNADIINCIYKRMTGKFPAANTVYTAHKCIINIAEIAVSSPTTYTYIVGRADKNGNPDFEHCSEEYTFTLYPASYTPRIYQTTDQQGFHWVEYQSWAAAAETINSQIIEETLNNNIIPVLVNTGDMTQSGARINEWLDYYNAGKSLFKHLEQMNVVGNNDLCGNDFTILGTGDDEGKANSYYFHVFYCYEVETEEGMIPIINNKYVPSLYRILFNDYLLLAVNSEITSVNCRGWFNAVLGNDVVNVYTGWTIPSSGTPQYVNSFTSVYTMIYNMTDLHDGYVNPNREIIAMCHEMPFTVITAENLENTTAIKGRWRSQSGASSLVGSHLNLISVNDTIGTHWFSRLLEYRGCKLCIGGHKHTYAVTYPLMENYIYGNSNSKDNGPMTMSETLENDNNVTWIVDGKNLSKFPLTTRTLPEASSDIFYPSEHVDSFYGNNKGVIYFMCLASGFKLMSNKELPSPDLTFSKFIPMSTIKRDSSNKITKSSASPEQRYPMYSIIELGSTWNVKLIRLANIQTNPTTLFTLINHGTSNVKKQYLYDNSDSTNQSEWKYGGWKDLDTILLTIS